MIKTAVLFYGKPKLLPLYTEPLKRLFDTFDLNPFLTDIFIHTWKTKSLTDGTSESVYEFIEDHYRPVKMMVEEQEVNSYTGLELDSESLLNMISIKQVCKMVCFDTNYSYYILIPFDVLFEENSKVNLNEIFNQKGRQAYILKDFIQVFNTSFAIEILSNIFDYTTAKITTELLRLLPLQKNGFSFIGDNSLFKATNTIVPAFKLIRNTYFFMPYVENIRNMPCYWIFTQSFNGVVYERSENRRSENRLGNEINIKITFLPISTNQYQNTYKWIGKKNIQSHVDFKFEVKMTNFDFTNSVINSKINNKLILLDEITENDVWYEIDLLNRKSLISNKTFIQNLEYLNFDTTNNTESFSCELRILNTNTYPGPDKD